MWEVIYTHPVILIAGYVAQWEQYTAGPHRNIQIPDGTHYIVSTHYMKITKVRKLSGII